LKEEGFPEWAVISMFSTQLKQSRNWNTAMRAIMQRGPRGVFNPPTYSRIWRLTTIGQTKDSYDWFGWKITVEAEVSDLEVYKMAREFSRQIDAGQVRISAPPSDFDEAAPGTDVPF
jgi:hypothetical protein